MTFDLVVQSPALEIAQTEQLAAMASAQGISRVSATAARLRDIQHDLATRQAVRDYGDSHGVDVAVVPARMALSDCKVLAMDMDSTLINIECIDEIADLAGLKTQVAAITEAAMRGEITDFAESLRRRVALLENVSAQALEDVYQNRLRLNPGAETLVASARSAGIKVLLVSGGFTFFTSRLAARLTLDAAYANELQIVDGKLTGRVEGRILDAAAKAAYLTEFSTQWGARKEQIIAIGDGANDLKMLGLAGFSVAYRAKPVVRAQAGYALNVSSLDAVLNWFEH